MKKKLFAVLALLCTALSPVAADNVILTSPEFYEVYDMSPNGKWACGGFNDFNNIYHAFRWNLETGETELLGSSESNAFGVNDDGIVSGEFLDTQVFASGAEVNMPGYWKDGSWHHLEMPEGNINSGVGYGGISADGHYVTGVVEVDGVYTPFIWKDGKIYRRLEAPFDAVTYCISPDGQAAGGWAYPEHDGKPGNRCAAYWQPDGQLKFLSSYEAAWCAAQKFSPDGKKILFWGGWNMNMNEAPKLAAIYDIETGTTDSIPSLSEAGFSVRGISNNGTVVGEMEFSGGGIIYKDGKTTDIIEYLESKGVDLSSVDIASEGGRLAIFSVSAISADASRIAIQYNDTQGANRTMIVMFDQEAGEVAPINVTAKQMQDINTVCLTWQKGLLAGDVLGYNVYRDGTKLNEEPIREMKYYDNVMVEGTYTYTVAAVYNDTEKVSDEVFVTVNAKSVSKPQTVFVRQKGVNSARMQWLEPETNFINRTYVDMETANLQGFGVTTDMSFEVAVNFDKADIANYAGNKVTKVQFYPMSTDATDWKLNLYTRNGDDGSLQLLMSQNITQPLNDRKFNTVALDTPLDLPDGDLIVGISVTAPVGMVFGMDYGRSEAGYSDLLRQSVESDFFSITEMSSSTSTPYITSWLMNVVLEPENASTDVDKVESYTIYADGNVVGETTELGYTVDALADGEHTLGVSATYADGKTSDAVSAALNVAANYKAVERVDVAIDEKNGLDASWTVPSDDDETFLTYASGEAAGRAPIGPADYNYGLMASVIFTPSMLKSYNGYRINAFRFYPTADALFTFYLQKNDEDIYTLDVDDYVLGQWNTVELPDEVLVDETAEYRLVLDCYDVTPEQPALAVDKTTEHQFYSDAYSLDGTYWSSISETGIHGNWMLGWVMADKNGKPLTVSGYDVNIDGVKKNQDMLTDTKFSYDFGTEAAGTHSISVDTYYPSVAESVKGTVTMFTIKNDPSGISNSTVETIRLRLGENYLRVEGDGVRTVTAYSLSGAKAASVKGNTLNITGLVPGVYVIKAKSAEGELVRKIEIRK